MCLFCLLSRLDLRFCDSRVFFFLGFVVVVVVAVVVAVVVVGVVVRFFGLFFFVGERIVTISVVSLLMKSPLTIATAKSASCVLILCSAVMSATLKSVGLLLSLSLNVCSGCW